jgi:hypothetical protein
MSALVGRDTEMARLRALLDDAAAGHAVTALVGGDAGVGKSRLVAEVMTVAGSSGFTVLCGQCAEIGDSVPYLPFADAFRTAPPQVEQAVKARPVLARLLPDGGEPAQGTDQPSMVGQQMFGAVLGALAELAATSPVVWVTKQPEAVLSAMALFIDVARGNAVAGERRTWLEPFWDDVFVAYIARGLLAEQALWRGDTETALAEAEAALSADARRGLSPAATRTEAAAIARAEDA